MNNRDRIRITLVYRMLAIALLVVIIPLYLLGLYVYGTGVNSIRKEISGSMISQTSFFMDNLENEITVIRQLEYDCLNDENIRQLSNMSKIMNDYEKIQSGNRLSNG